MAKGRPSDDLTSELQRVEEKERAKLDEKSILQDQMRKLEQTLKETNAEISVKNKQIRTLREDKEATSTVQRKSIATLEHERVRQERDSQIKSLLTKMSEKNLPLASFEKGESLSVPHPTLHTVKVKYPKGVRDGDLDRLKSCTPYEVSFRITKMTTFEQLKEAAMKFWNIESENQIELRAPNFAHLNLILNQKPDSPSAVTEHDPIVDQKSAPSAVTVHDLIVDQKSAPEFWLIELNTSAKRLLDEEEQFFADPKVASGFRDSTAAVQNSHTKNDPGKQKNYHKFMEEYYGLAGYVPAETQKEPQPIDKHDTSCVTATVLLLLLVMTVFVLSARRSVEEAFWLTQMIRAKLFNEYNYEKTEFTVADTYELNDFILNNLAYSILQSELDPHVTINDKCLVIGPVKIRVLRTQTTSCKGDTFDQDVVCYEAEYDVDTRNETSIYIDDNFSLPFLTASENDIDSTVFGDFSLYDGSGNTYDLDTDMT
jgi:hypothetical protein